MPIEASFSNICRSSHLSVPVVRAGLQKSLLRSWIISALHCQTRRRILRLPVRRTPQMNRRKGPLTGQRASWINWWQQTWTFRRHVVEAVLEEESRAFISTRKPTQTQCAILRGGEGVLKTLIWKRMNLEDLTDGNPVMMSASRRWIWLIAWRVILQNRWALTRSKRWYLILVHLVCRSQLFKLFKAGHKEALYSPVEFTRCADNSSEALQLRRWSDSQGQSSSEFCSHWLGHATLFASRASGSKPDHTILTLRACGGFLCLDSCINLKMRFKVHNGNPETGHYTAKAKNLNSGEWLRFDDNQSGRVSIEEVQVVRTGHCVWNKSFFALGE